MSDRVLAMRAIEQARLCGVTLFTFQSALLAYPGRKLPVLLRDELTRLYTPICVLLRLAALE